LNNDGANADLGGDLAQADAAIAAAREQRFGARSTIAPRPARPLNRLRFRHTSRG
jgi:hypothetical protein